MKFIITFSIISFLFLFVLVFLINRVTGKGIYVRFAIGYVALLLFTSLVVYIEELWEPSMGLGLLFFMFAIFVGSLLNSFVVGGMVYREKMEKNLLYLSLTIILLSPLFAYLSYSAISWYNVDRHWTTNCFSNDGKNYSLSLDSRDSSASILEELGPGAASGYFDGNFRHAGESIIIKGERVISYKNVKKRIYTLTNQQIIGFPEKQDTVQIKPCN